MGCCGNRWQKKPWRKRGREGGWQRKILEKKDRREEVEELKWVMGLLWVMGVGVVGRASGESRAPTRLNEWTWNREWSLRAVISCPPPALHNVRLTGRGTQREASDRTDKHGRGQIRKYFSVDVSPFSGGKLFGTAPRQIIRKCLCFSLSLSAC